MKNKILLLVHLPPPDYGVTTLNNCIVSGVLTNYFEADIVSINTSKDLESIERTEIGKVFIFLGIFLNVLKKLIRNDYRLCYFTLTPRGVGFYKDFLLILLLNLFRVKKLLHLHGLGISSENSFLKGILCKLCFKDSKVIIISKLLMFDVNRSVDSKNVFILPNGMRQILDEEGAVELLREREKSVSNNKVPRILFLANMIRSKGVFTVLDSISILRKKGYDFKFSFVGKWYDVNKGDFFSKIKDYQLTDVVEYLGFRTGQEKAKILKEADIFLYPTLKDAFPLVLLEAMQFGLPVVSTFEGAIPEIVDDSITGFLVGKNNPTALAEKTELLINNSDLRLKMGKAGREKFLREYKFEKFENKLMEIFNEVIGKNN